jgi:molybdate/tungstate transport system substrate-binding protein
MEKVKYLCIIILFLLILSLIPGCEPTVKTEVLVLNAGSLVIPLAQVEEEYEKLHPDIDLRFEGHGSIQVVRHITEIGDAASVAMVADYSLLPLLMYPASLPDGDGFYADWHIRFATNRLGIAFTDESVYGDEITEDNWYEVLMRDDVNLGISDPRLDAVGYRSLMLIQLAEEYYGDGTLFERLISQNFSPPIYSEEDDFGVFQISIPELLEAKIERFYLRGFSVQLLSLLESHQIDYAFEYESVARQHNLHFLALPREIDLSLEAYQDIYAGVNVNIEFRRFETVNPVFSGLPIIYGITIPASAPYPEEAVDFLEFFLGPEGQQILSENYQPPLVPLETDNLDAMPERLRHLIPGGE